MLVAGEAEVEKFQENVQSRLGGDANRKGRDSREKIVVEMAKILFQINF